MTWLMENFMIYLEAELLIKYYLSAIFKKYLKILKAFNISKNLKYVGYQHGLASMVYKYFDEKSTVVNTSAVAIKSELS